MMYWDEIWEATDQKRITAYVKKCDLTPDAVIRYLHKRGAVVSVEMKDHERKNET